VRLASSHAPGHVDVINGRSGRSIKRLRNKQTAAL
jgi:hypothetical protein